MECCSHTPGDEYRKLLFSFVTFAISRMISTIVIGSLITLERALTLMMFYSKFHKFPVRALIQRKISSWKYNTCTRFMKSRVKRCEKRVLLGEVVSLNQTTILWERNHVHFFVVCRSTIRGESGISISGIGPAIAILLNWFHRFWNSSFLYGLSALYRTCTLTCRVNVVSIALFLVSNYQAIVPWCFALYPQSISGM